MNFTLEGLDVDGRFVSLQVSAADALEAERLGKQRGIDVLAVNTRQSGMPQFGKLKFPLLLFNQELLALLEAGLSIVETLETLLDKESRTENRQVLQSAVSRLHEGQTLSAAFESQPDAFPELYVASVRSSERSGNLAESLRRYVAYQIQVDKMRKKIVAASIYPALLMLVGGLVVLFLLIYVIPKFSHIYADSRHELPLASKLLVKWGELIEHSGGLLAGLGLAALSFGIYLLTRPQVRGWLRELLWHTPVIGERMRVYQLSRFYRTLGMLMSAGIPVMAALERVSGMLDRRLQLRLVQARNLVREGQPMSFAMEQSGLSTAVAQRLLRVGERSGQMGSMMDRIADFHEEELNRWIDWASRLFEPLLMTFIGIVIGAIVVLMYIPIFELASSIE